MTIGFIGLGIMGSRMAAVTCFEQNVPLPLGNAAKEVYALAKQKGLAEFDFSAIYHFLSEDGG